MVSCSGPKWYKIPQQTCSCMSKMIGTKYFSIKKEWAISNWKHPDNDLQSYQQLYPHDYLDIFPLFIFAKNWQFSTMTLYCMPIMIPQMHICKIYFSNFAPKMVSFLSITAKWKRAGYYIHLLYKINSSEQGICNSKVKSKRCLNIWNLKLFISFAKVSRSMHIEW